MNESNPCDAALAELLSLTMEVDESVTIYRNHLGQFHRVHGPAVISIDGSQYWYQNGLLHRTGGPAVIISAHAWWFINDELLTERIQ